MSRKNAQLSCLSHSGHGKAKQGTLFDFGMNSSKRAADEDAVRNEKRKISKNSYEAESRERKFLSKWKKDFPWVIFDDDVGHIDTCTAR